MCALPTASQRFPFPTHWKNSPRGSTCERSIAPLGYALALPSVHLVGCSRPSARFFSATDVWKANFALGLDLDDIIPKLALQDPHARRTPPLSSRAPCSAA